MTKGNIEINRSIAKTTANGTVVQELPLILFNGRMMPLFSVIPPEKCVVCANSVESNQNYDRFIISSYGIIRVPTTYWICSNPNCKKHHTDIIIGVTGSANYSDEFIEKQKCVRYNGRCTLNNTNTIGEIFTEGLTDTTGRAPCPTTLWKYEQKAGKVNAQKLLDEEIHFDGTLYIDGYYVKMGWRKYVEEQYGREFTKHEWKLIRNKVIYVVATYDKVVLDFEIANRMPSHLELIPLMNRIKNRIPEAQLKKIVSDEDNAIIGAVKEIFPDVDHSFCVFHQLENVTRKYLDVFHRIEDIPIPELELYEHAKDLIVAEEAITSTIYYQKILEIASNIELSEASEKVIEYIKKIYRTNKKLLENGFLPETNNVMEQLFSLINDFVIQARSFKIIDGMANFFYNLFVFFNNRQFNTGPWRGTSPVDRAKINNG